MKVFPFSFSNIFHFLASKDAKEKAAKKKEKYGGGCFNPLFSFQLYNSSSYKHEKLFFVCNETVLETAETLLPSHK